MGAGRDTAPSTRRRAGLVDIEAVAEPDVIEPRGLELRRQVVAGEAVVTLEAGSVAVERTVGILLEVDDTQVSTLGQQGAETRQHRLEVEDVWRTMTLTISSKRSSGTGSAPRSRSQTLVPAGRTPAATFSAITVRIPRMDPPG